MDNSIKLFTVSETAKMLRLSVSKVYRMLSLGELQCIRIGTRKMISYEDILEFLKLHRSEPPKRIAPNRRHF